jgi:hypothetical protein
VSGDELSMLPGRFWRRVHVTDGCWIWLTPADDGYGRFQLGWHRKRAHAWTWETLHGPVPAGLVIDHLCRVRACVRPDHLRVTTPRENTLAAGSLAIAKVHAEKTHCPHGHEYTELNTIRRDGRRRCRTCVNAARRARRAAA